MEKEEIKRLVIETIKEYNKSGVFTDRKTVDTPTEALSPVNKKYIDDLTLDDLSGVTLTSEAQGDVIYRGASAWNNLAAGTNGQALTTNGASANPAWQGMTTQGDVEYHNGTDRVRLAPGTSGQLLKTQGASANPIWSSILPRYASANTNLTIGAVTSDTTYLSVSIPANTLGANGILRVMVAITVNNSADSSQLRIHFGNSGTGPLDCQIPVSFVDTILMYYVCSNRGATDSQVISGYVIGGDQTLRTITGGEIQTSAVDTTLAQNLVIHGNKNNGGNIDYTFNFAWVEVIT